MGHGLWPVKSLFRRRRYTTTFRVRCPLRAASSSSTVYARLSGLPRNLSSTGTHEGWGREKNKQISNDRERERDRGGKETLEPKISSCFSKLNIAGRNRCCLHSSINTHVILWLNTCFFKIFIELICEMLWGNRKSINGLGESLCRVQQAIGLGMLSISHLSIIEEKGMKFQRWEKSTCHRRS